MEFDRAFSLFQQAASFLGWLRRQKLLPFSLAFGSSTEYYIHQVKYFLKNLSAHRGYDVAVQGKVYLCVHGHFYQPPREDPFTGVIPVELKVQKTGFRNFNEKITAECYAPNALKWSNFAHVSFDVGPTLFEWLGKFRPDVHDAIIAQAHKHYQVFGVSNALAQPFNHTILPLVPHYRDIYSEIKWGIADYKQRFGRNPKGMWLPETAVDYRTLGIMTDYGISYTILAPWQATVDTIDTTEPYLIRFTDGSSITIFFYNAALSGPVSFDNPITDNAENFVKEELPKHVNQWKKERGIAQLILIATDGELYGHHKRGRDEFLYYLLQRYAPAYGYEVTTLERYMKRFPATKTIRIREKTAWSCHHGELRRWWSGCGCTNEGDAKKNYWKQVVRTALNNLYTKAFPIFEEYTRPAIPGGYLARNDYIALRSGLLTEDEFWKKYGKNNQKPLDAKLAYNTMLLFEAQYYMQQAFTSCGWFWERFDGQHTQNNIASAYRAMSLIYQATGKNLEGQFISDLLPVARYKPVLTTLAPREFEQEMHRRYFTHQHITPPTIAMSQQEWKKQQLERFSEYMYEEYQRITEEAGGKVLPFDAWLRREMKKLDK